MTENKRFEVMDYFDSENKSIKAIRDTKTTEIYSMDNELEANSVCIKFNELAEEIEQLKQQVEDLEFELRTIKAYDRTVKEEHSDSVYDFQKKLEKW